MGIEINKTKFTKADYQCFQKRLETNLEQLREILLQSSFGNGPTSFGAELEMYVIDDQGDTLGINQKLLESANDPQLTLELNHYNLEYNLTPYKINQCPLQATEQEILTKVKTLNQLAAAHGGQVVPIGILPTLSRNDFGPKCLTQRKRYFALVEQLVKRRGSHFNIHINGIDPIKIDMEDVTLEGANTSFQIHFQVKPDDYADFYNAVQLMTPLVVAIGANSPTLFGHVLWHETRIPLFKQSIDTRVRGRYQWQPPARVNYGQGWARKGALELFTEAVRLFPPLLPLSSATTNNTTGSAPSLDELRLHQSTIWPWNRAVYDNLSDGGQLRIEMRALPAGPTAVDMVANAALLLGLAAGIKTQINQLIPALPFHIAEYNFYRAAQYGLDARLVWPRLKQSGSSEEVAYNILCNLLETAQQGLKIIGFSQAEITKYLTIIEQRLARRQTGASWQRQILQQQRNQNHHKKVSREALHTMLTRYLKYSNANLPIAEWPMD